MVDQAAQIPIVEFSLAEIPLGVKRRYHLLVDRLPDGRSLTFPALVARGVTPGNTLLATGCVHGDEYEGPVAIQDQFAALAVDEMQGTFFGIPVLNGPAFVAGQRESGLDHLNLARIFPGAAGGSVSQRIAHAFQHYIVGQADLYVDVHSGGNAYAIKELAGYQVRPGALGQTQKEAAIAFGLDLVWGTDPLPGRTLSAAGEVGVPAIYVELRGEGRCRPDQRALATRGIRNLLAYLDILPGEFPSTSPRYCFETLGGESGHLQLDHPSPAGGIFVPAVDVWEEVNEGDYLGHVRHIDGTQLAAIHAERSGHVLLLRTFPRVFAGDTLAFVLALPGPATMPRNMPG